MAQRSQAGLPRSGPPLKLDLTINGEAVSIEADPDTPLLWAIREQIGLTGTKFGCGVGMCGACTVHFNGAAVRSCVLPAAAAVGQQVTTIEGLGSAVQQAWIDAPVPQCGYCQSGQIMAAASLLAKTPDPTDEQIDAAMTNLCRCATYPRIREGIRRAIELSPPPPPAPVPLADELEPTLPPEGTP